MSFFSFTTFVSVIDTDGTSFANGPRRSDLASYFTFWIKGVDLRAMPKRNHNCQIKEQATSARCGLEMPNIENFQWKLLEGSGLKISFHQ